MAGKAFFMLRLNDHVQYLKKMDAALKGQLDFQGTSHTECKLGKWLYGEGANEVATLQNDKAKVLFESIFEPHEHFHLVGKEALDKKLAGDLKEAESKLTELHKLSSVLVNKLLELDTMK